jgi:alpha-mannosidase
MNNYWDTNYRAAQGGEGVFRYVVTSGPAFEPQALSRLAWSHLKPVEINQVVGQDKVGNPPRPLPPEGASFLEIDQPNIVLLTWKRAEDAQGTILRLYETGGRDTEASLRFLRTAVHTAHLANGVEDNLSALAIDGSSLRVSFHPHEVVTLRVE